MFTDGMRIVAELPLEHLAMYNKYNRLCTLIKKGATCECCLKPAGHFAVVKRSKKGHNVFALFTDDWVELTVDHIIAKANGGKNNVNNYQVLCRYCNLIKGCSEMTIEELRGYIAKIYNSVVVFTKPIDLQG